MLFYQCRKYPSTGDVYALQLTFGTGGALSSASRGKRGRGVGQTAADIPVLSICFDRAGGMLRRQANALQNRRRRKIGQVKAEEPKKRYSPQLHAVHVQSAHVRSLKTSKTNNGNSHRPPQQVLANSIFHAPKKIPKITKQPLLDFYFSTKIENTIGSLDETANRWKNEKKNPLPPRQFKTTKIAVKFQKF